MMLRCTPTGALAPYVERLWYLDESADPPRPRAARERALPTGSANLVVRLSDEPVRVFRDVDDRVGAAFGHAVLSGTRSTYYVRDTSRPSCSVGVHFRPGGAAALLGVPGEELAERHVSLEDLWGRSTAELRERLLAERLPAARVRVLEESLLRVGRRAPVHPAVEHALARLAGRTPCSIEALALETGYSHKHLIALFRRAVGLTPKIYARIRRFQRVIASASDGRASGWAAVALACDFYDQAHLTRDFQAFAGLAPGAYAPLSAERPNHVPIDEPR